LLLEARRLGAPRAEKSVSLLHGSVLRLDPDGHNIEAVYHGDR
jgi:hypothetical protein